MNIKNKNRHPINEVYAILSVDEDGNEGIVTMSIGDMVLPCVFGHKEMFEKAKGRLLDKGCLNLKHQFRFVKFTHKEII